MKVIWFTRRWPKLLLLLIGVSLISTRYTSADLSDVEKIRDNYLRATTLNFSNRQTANELQTSELFNISGLIANGFEVESVRIKQEGELKFTYQIEAADFSGSEDLCQALQVKVFDDWSQVYAGSLTELNLESAVSDPGYDDLVFVLSLADAAGLDNKSCNFNVKINTVSVDHGFSDEEVLQNQVSTAAHL